MSKNIKFMLSILTILIFIIFIRSMKSTAAMVQIAEIDKKTSHYLVVFKSNILQKNRLEKIEKLK